MTPTNCGTFALPLKLKQLESSEYLHVMIKATPKTAVKWLCSLESNASEIIKIAIFFQISRINVILNSISC